MTKTQANTYRRRLLKLADFLDDLPPNRFEYGNWVGDNWKGAQDLSCGTTACAMGWACTIPSFRRLGARLVADACSNGSVTTTKGGGYQEAAHLLFGLDSREARFLFVPGVTGYDFGLGSSPEYAATAEHVAAHIRRFVAQWKPENTWTPDE